MEIRVFTPSDMDELKRIHALHYAHEFEMPQFMYYLSAYLVEDEKGIISFSGIRHILESVTVTNRDRSPRDRIKALREILEMTKFATLKCGYDQIYVWSQKPKWAKILKKHGFREPQGESLILDL